jgi:hypothetical protein
MGDDVSHINDSTYPFSDFLQYFAEFLTLPVVQTNRHYYNYTDRIDNRTFPEPDVTKPRCLRFWHWQYKWDMA